MFRRFKHLFYRLGRGIAKSTGTPHQIALGVGIGFFIAWLPIVGIQMIVAIVICQIVHANKVVPLFPIWITNPVTIVPIYSFNYWLGWKIVGGPPLREIVKVLSRLVDFPAKTAEAGRIALWWDGVRHGLGEIFSLGWDMLLPLWLGCTILGLVLGVVGYYLTLWLVNSFRSYLLGKKNTRRTAREQENDF